MKVVKNASGTLSIELCNQAEIDAMWLLAGHVGGSYATLRRVFSNVMGEQPGLFELLDPYVSPLERTGNEPGGVPRPRAIAALAGVNYEQYIDGHLNFQPLNGEAFDECCALQAVVTDGESGHLPEARA